MFIKIARRSDEESKKPELEIRKQVVCDAGLYQKFLLLPTFYFASLPQILLHSYFLLPNFSRLLLPTFYFLL
jgi:hypothetical protein